MWKITTYWPLGGDHAVYMFWSSITEELDLPLLTALYNEGLTARGPEQLSQLERELDALQGYWDTHELHDPDPRSGLHGRESEELQESMGYLREGIRVARETGGRIRHLLRGYNRSFKPEAPTCASVLNDLLVRIQLASVGGGPA